MGARALESNVIVSTRARARHDASTGLVDAMDAVERRARMRSFDRVVLERHSVVAGRRRARRDGARASVV